MANVFQSLRNLFSLRVGEEDKQKVLQDVHSNIFFTGPQLWILAGAIFIASVGLNVNSTAVIIGAMLISPLMGPIVGAGFALGTFDVPLLRRALRSLLSATVVGLVVSTFYFMLSPLKEAQPEILSRISPNIYDVFIAFIGGAVGAVAYTRVERGNPIPGVAIATALMPPLCTAGYEVAAGNWQYALGALFLYSINCVFICIATYLIVRALGYPVMKQESDRNARRVKIALGVITILLAAPSVYFAVRLLEEQHYRRRVGNFIKTEFEAKGHTVIFQKTSLKTEPRMIELAFLSHHFSPEEVAHYNALLPEYDLQDTRVRILQDSNFFAQRSATPKEENEIATDPKALEMIAAKANLDRYQSSENILPEAAALFPQLQTLRVIPPAIPSTDSTKTIFTVLYEPSTALGNPERVQFYRWLRSRLEADSVVLFTTPTPVK